MAIVAKLIYLHAVNPDRKDVTMYINCASGYTYPGLAIFDVMKQFQTNIQTICIGEATGIATLLLAAGSKGHRWATPLSRIGGKHANFATYPAKVRAHISVQLHF